jgi:hypothetical protein
MDSGARWPDQQGAKPGGDDSDDIAGEVTDHCCFSTDLGDRSECGPRILPTKYFRVDPQVRAG